jgi:ribosomal protein S6
MNIKEPRVYNLIFLLKNEEDKKEILDILASQGAEVLADSLLKKIKLAYSIKQESFGLLGSMTFSVQPDQIAKINDQLRINFKILRFSIEHAQSLSVGFQLSDGQAGFEEKRDVSALEADAKDLENYTNINKQSELIVNISSQGDNQSTSALEKSDKDILSNEELERKLKEILG